VIYVGAKTGRDGIHGATMASEEFTEAASRSDRTCRWRSLYGEAAAGGLPGGDGYGRGARHSGHGAAGLTCSTCEMGARGELGVSIELDNVPQRETA